MLTTRVVGAHPSFSHDGRSIYYAGPDGTGRWHIWKVAVSGGTAAPVTDRGDGFPVGVPVEAFDGRSVFYLTTPERASEL